jgi:hypothetical protein
MTYNIAKAENFHGNLFVCIKDYSYAFQILTKVQIYYAYSTRHCLFISCSKLIQSEAAVCMSSNCTPTTRNKRLYEIRILKHLLTFQRSCPLATIRISRPVTCDATTSPYLQKHRLFETLQ